MQEYLYTYYASIFSFEKNQGVYAMSKINISFRYTLQTQFIYYTLFIYLTDIWHERNKKKYEGRVFWTQIDIFKLTRSAVLMCASSLKRDDKTTLIIESLQFAAHQSKWPAKNKHIIKPLCTRFHAIYGEQQGVCDVDL